jgi:hypothetical protein
MNTPVQGDTLTVQLAVKPWWRSKTLWFNALAFALAAVELNAGLLRAVLPANWFAWFAFGVPIANALLRAFTHTALAGRNGCPLPPVSQTARQGDRP